MDGAGRLAHPPPCLPRKGGGVSIQLLAHEAFHIHERHLPPCGGGWEGGEPHAHDATTICCGGRRNLPVPGSESTLVPSKASLPRK